MARSILRTVLAALPFLFILASCERIPTRISKIAPLVTTAEVSSVTRTSAECGGRIVSDGGDAVTALGLCWSTDESPTVAGSLTVEDPGSESYISSMTGLSTHTTYYVRAHATNSTGTGYGNTVSFTTLAGMTAGPKMMDIDGNEYDIVTIGDQVWMAENLKVTHYRNGEEIPYGFGYFNTGHYGIYENDVNMERIYGCLYNWYAVNDNRKLAPEGWHVPTREEWDTLIEYLGGEDAAGDKMKDGYWADNYVENHTNECGFSALGAGMWYINKYVYFHESAVFWTSSEYSGGNNAWHVMLNGGDSGVGVNSSSRYFGYSVRCIKD